MGERTLILKVYAENPENDIVDPMKEMMSYRYHVLKTYTLSTTQELILQRPLLGLCPILVDNPVTLKPVPKLKSLGLPGPIKNRTSQKVAMLQL